MEEIDLSTALAELISVLNIGNQCIPSQLISLSSETTRFICTLVQTKMKSLPPMYIRHICRRLILLDQAFSTHCPHNIYVYIIHIICMYIAEASSNLPLYFLCMKHRPTPNWLLENMPKTATSNIEHILC